MKDLDDNEGDDGRLQPKCRAKKPKSQSGGKYFFAAAIDSFLNRLIIVGLHDFTLTPYGIILRSRTIIVNAYSVHSFSVRRASSNSLVATRCVARPSRGPHSRAADSIRPLWSKEGLQR